MSSEENLTPGHNLMAIIPHGQTLTMPCQSFLARDIIRSTITPTGYYPGHK